MTKERHAKHEPAPKGAEPKAPAPAEDAEALKDRLLRLQADFENFRKRTAREQADVCQRANEDLVLRLLPVMDHFELGLRNAQIHHAESAVTEGFRLVYDQMLAALKDAGLTPVEAEGQVFDPQIHEAVSHMPSETIPADSVITQTRRGYQLGSRLLRAAQVVVSSGPQASPAGEAPAPAEDGGEPK